mmetsp:Transcript_25203/g.81307  ORF Transcript_25203/g.81307 Transcript_25203/m.81307 type:complete len:523 (+) Transcript_25203:241-1809(+)
MGNDEERRSRAHDLHDHWLQTVDEVLVRLPARVAVVELVLLALRKLGRHLLFDLLVRHAVAHTRIDLVELPPADHLTPKSARRLEGALECGRPHHEVLPLRIMCSHELGESIGVRFASWAQPGIAADLARRVEHALTVPGEPDWPRDDVKIGQEEDEARVKIAANVVCNQLLVDIDQLDVAAVLDRVHRLVDGHVVLDPLEEVLHGRLCLHALVVRRQQLGLPHVGPNDDWVRAAALHEDDTTAGHALGDALLEPGAPRSCGICCIIHCNLQRALQLSNHVRHRRFGHLLACPHALLVGGVEEVVAHARAQKLAAVVAHVEPTHIVPHPTQVAGHVAGDVRLASRRQAHHDDDKLALPQDGSAAHLGPSADGGPCRQLAAPHRSQQVATEAMHGRRAQQRVRLHLSLHGECGAFPGCRAAGRRGRCGRHGRCGGHAMQVHCVGRGALNMPLHPLRILIGPLQCLAALRHWCCRVWRHVHEVVDVAKVITLEGLLGMVLPAPVHDELEVVASDGQRERCHKVA